MNGITDALTLMLAAYAGQKQARRQKMMDELAQRGINLKERELDQPDYQSFYDPKSGRIVRVNRKASQQEITDLPVLGDIPAGFRYEGGRASFIPGLPTKATNVEGGRMFTTDIPTGKMTEGPPLSPTFSEQTGRIGAEAARTGAEAARTGAEASKQGVVIPYGSKLRLPSGEIVDNTRQMDLGDLYKQGVVPELENGQWTGKYKTRPRTPQEIRAELQKWVDLKTRIATAQKGDPTEIKAVLSQIEPIIDALVSELRGTGTLPPPPPPAPSWWDTSVNAMRSAAGGAARFTGDAWQKGSDVTRATGEIGVDAWTRAMQNVDDALKAIRRPAVPDSARSVEFERALKALEAAFPDTSR